MKFLVVLSLALAVTSANVLDSFDVPVHPRDLPQIHEPEGRITNGKDAAVGQFPYQVALTATGSKGSWTCGATLIDQSWILTAAHCTSGANTFKIYLGATVRSKPKVTYTVSSSNVIQHKNYSSITLNNDISLIKIPTVSYTSDIRNIALPKRSSSSSTYTGQNAIASGWGLTYDGATAISSKLQYASLQVIDNSVCSKAYGSLVVRSSTICTATPNGVSTCSGDSGGPLVLASPQELIGVTSFVSSSGCQSGSPAGFVRVTSFLDWIAENTGISY